VEQPDLPSHNKLEKEHYDIIKHSSAIQIENKLSLTARKTYNVLLQNAYNLLSKQDEYTIPLRKIIKDIEIGQHNYQYVKDTFKALVETAVEWNILGKDKKDKWGISTLLAHAEVDDGILTYSFSSFLRKKLANPRIYAKINLKVQNRFSSSRALALYELCLDYLFPERGNAGETPWIDIQTYKKIMGIDDTKYMNDFKEINREAIKMPVTEINTLSDIFVTVEYKKEKKKVLGVKFYVAENPNDNNLVRPRQKKKKLEHQSQEKPLNKELYERMTGAFKINPGDVIKLLQQYSHDLIADNLKYAEKQAKAGKIKITIGGYARRAIEENYAKSQPKLFDNDDYGPIKEAIERKLRTKYEEYKQQTMDTFKETASPTRLRKIEEKAQEYSETHDGLSIRTCRKIVIEEYLSNDGTMQSFDGYRKQFIRED